MINPFDSAIQHYQSALAALTTAKAPVPASVVLAVLTARNDVQTALEASQSASDTLQTLSELDQQLRQLGGSIAPFTQSADWRSSFSPKETAWWWFLAAPKTKWAKFDWLWTGLSVTCLTISLGLVTDISSRFLKGGPDTVGAIAVSSQSVLTLLAVGGALTKVGREGGKATLKGLKVPEPYWASFGAVGSCVLLAGAVGLRQSLPSISDWYTGQGRAAYERQDWGSAEELYKRAIELNSDNDGAHFGLGRLYEDLQKLDEARTQYQFVGPKMPEAVNNLARLNIMKKEYSIAVALLQKPLSENQDTIGAETRFALLKNMGWARVKQGNYADANTWLRDAIKLGKKNNLSDEKMAAAHCLQALVIEGKGNPKAVEVAQKKALPEWKLCGQYGSSTVPEEDEWLTLAQKRLTDLEAN